MTDQITSEPDNQIKAILIQQYRLAPLQNDQWLLKADLRLAEKLGESNRMPELRERLLQLEKTIMFWEDEIALVTAPPNGNEPASGIGNVIAELKDFVDQKETDGRPKLGK